MKTKISVILLMSILLLTGCNDGEGKEYDVKGINLGGSHFPGGFTLFVEDNINGQEIDYTGFQYDNFNKDSYELEAYHLLINKDTKVIADRTGEEIAFEDEEYNDFSFHSYPWLWVTVLNDMSVNTVEEFEPQVLTDREYILWDWALLPAYTAEEIRIYPVTFDNYLSKTVYRGENMIHILQVVDRITDENQFWNENEEMYKKLDRFSRENFYVNYSYLIHDDWEIFNEPLETDEFPIYYITDETGIIETATDKEKVFEFLDNTIDNM